MSFATRYIEIKNDNQHQLIVGFVLQKLAKDCDFSAEELANKARVGVTYVNRIYYGLAPFMQEFQIRRFCEAMDVKMSDFYSMVERINFSQVRMARKIEERIVFAGGNRKKVQSKVKLKPITGGKK